MGNERLQGDSREKTEKMKTQKQLLGKNSREIQATDKKIQKESAALGATRPKYIKAKESTKHKQSKQSQNEATLEKHKQDLVKQKESVADYENEQNTAEKAKKTYVKNWEDRQKKRKKDKNEINLTDADK